MLFETKGDVLHAAVSQQPVANLSVLPGGNVPSRIIKWDLERRCHCFIGPLAGGHFTAMLVSTNRQTETVSLVSSQQQTSSVSSLKAILSYFEKTAHMQEFFFFFFYQILLRLCINLPFRVIPPTSSCGPIALNVSTWVCSHLFDWISHPG